MNMNKIEHEVLVESESKRSSKKARSLSDNETTLKDYVLINII